MNFPPEFLDEIRNRISVSAVVGRRVKLIKRGREFVGLSPFNNEKTPSFTVNDEKGFYHCFSTNEHGDIFTFLMKTQNLSFPEAVERLADDVGLEMPRNDPREVAVVERAVKLREAVEAACMFFQAALQKPEGKRALEYLHGRGLGDEIIQKYRLGFAPSGNVLKTELKRRGYSEDVLMDVRLISEGKEGRDSFDFFRDRVMFPIFDAKGRPVAFGGRVMGDGEPKYLNSPETPLFHKGGLLYGLSLARPQVLDKNQVVVCEGYMDVIAMAQAGFGNAVAPLGTALTETQLEMLWKLVPEPIVCFDGDKAGARAASRTLNMILPKLNSGHSAKFALMPSGKDPDDLIRQSGPYAMAQVLSLALPLSELLWKVLVDSLEIKTPEQRSAFIRETLKKLREIPDRIIQREYWREFKPKIAALFNEVTGSRTLLRRRNLKNAPLVPVARRQFDKGAVDHANLLEAEKMLLLPIINNPQIFGAVADRLMTVHFVEKSHHELADAIIDLLGSLPDLDHGSFLSALCKRGFESFCTAATEPWFLKLNSFARVNADLKQLESAWSAIFDVKFAAPKIEKEIQNASQNSIKNNDLSEIKRAAALEKEKHKLLSMDSLN